MIYDINHINFRSKFIPLSYLSQFEGLIIDIYITPSIYKKTSYSFKFSKKNPLDMYSVEKNVFNVYTLFVSLFKKIKKQNKKYFLFKKFQAILNDEISSFRINFRNLNSIEDENFIKTIDNFILK